MSVLMQEVNERCDTKDKKKKSDHAIRPTCVEKTKLPVLCINEMTNKMEALRKI